MQADIKTLQVSLIFKILDKSDQNYDFIVVCYHYNK